ncbi:MAG TPA: SET domain-containing protein [Candidatus Saccharimonadales bacterium]|nr:SET domain-containing protein [Candidatus Saccharimonadales bacterium]
MEALFSLKPSARDLTGVGCFAVGAIRAGTRLHIPGDTGTRRLSLEEVPDTHLKYCPLLESGDFLAPANFALMSVFWYINHDRDPNVIADGWRLFAKQDMPPGEELTLYYPDLLTHPKNKLWVIPELHV